MCCSRKTSPVDAKRPKATSKKCSGVLDIYLMTLPVHNHKKVRISTRLCLQKCCPCLYCCDWIRKMYFQLSCSNTDDLGEFASEHRAFLERQQSLRRISGKHIMGNTREPWLYWVETNIVSVFASERRNILFLPVSLSPAPGSKVETLKPLNSSS